MKLARIEVMVGQPKGNVALQCAQLLKDLESLPFRVMQEAHQFIMAEVPVYTGTYKGAIKMETHFAPGMASATIFMNKATLLESASQNKEPASVSSKYPDQTPTEYIDADVLVIEGEDTFVIVAVGDNDSGRSLTSKGVYPERIEREGSPVQHEGQALWERTGEFANAIWDVALGSLSTGLPSNIGGKR